jgi:transcriptional regulator with XRE-family HTH domain
MAGQSDDTQARGSWLRQQREYMGLTQAELAERAGLATRTISNLESDRIRRPHPRSLRMVAAALGLSDDARSELQARFKRRKLSADESSGGGFQALAVPRQLPAAVTPFVGRPAELASLTGWLDQTRPGSAGPALFLISGMAGVGKTTLALHWAHQVASQFPDGQLHLNLGGPGQLGQSANQKEALAEALLALGITPLRIPAGLADQARLFRGLVARRRMLISIDNAKDAAQVAPLLPGPARCTVVVTSRTQLVELAMNDGARLLRLQVPEPAEAVRLLSVRLGADKVLAEPQAVRELVELCGSLPLALVIVAARVTLSGWPLAAHVSELADPRQRLSVLDLGDSSADVRSAFSWSGQQLSASAASMLRLLASQPGPDYGAQAVASLAGVPLKLAQSALSELTLASLITEHPPGRYTVHNLVKLYAAE